MEPQGIPLGDRDEVAGDLDERANPDGPVEADRDTEEGPLGDRDEVAGDLDERANPDGPT